MPYSSPEGTADMLAPVARLWAHTTAIADRLFTSYGYEPIATPMFELTEVFVRGIGESTDVVGKEMFVVRSGENYRRSLEAGTDEFLKSKQKLSLRPEGTAGTVRAVLQHALTDANTSPAKLFYAGPMFRAERPQKGRLRQFHQIGVECLGATSPTADAEAIIMMMRLFELCPIPKSSIRLLINSMGDEHCRPAYREQIRTYITDHSSELCEECQRRATTNPLRAFDCKNEHCAQVMAHAPKISDALCDDCREHYEKVKSLLDRAGVEYIEDYTLVRGLDYYTRTVFEAQVIDGMGSQSAIGGGGRYDGLAQTFGSKPLAGLGFAVGFERMMLALEAAGISPAQHKRVDGFIACVDESVRDVAFELTIAARDAGLIVEMDHQGKSLKSQFKYADKLGARVVVILGPDELEQGSARVRSMGTHVERIIDIDTVRKIFSQFDGRRYGSDATTVAETHYDLDAIFSLESDSKE